MSSFGPFLGKLVLEYPEGLCSSVINVTDAIFENQAWKINLN